MCNAFRQSPCWTMRPCEGPARVSYVQCRPTDAVLNCEGHVGVGGVQCSLAGVVLDYEAL